MACRVCEKLAEGKANFVFNDPDASIILPTKPAAPGHMKVIPKVHFAKLDEMKPELVEKIMLLSSFASAAAFDITKAHGTNIILNETEEHLVIDVIPRKENDGLNFAWKPKQAAPPELDEVFAKIKDKTFLVGKKDDKKPQATEVRKNVEKITDGKGHDPDPHDLELEEEFEPDAEEKGVQVEKVNYLLKNLERQP